MPAFTGRRAAGGALAFLATLCGPVLAALLAVTGGRHGTPYPVDAGIHGWVLAHRPAAAVDVAVAVTVSGTGVVAYLLAGVGGVLVWRRGWWRGAVVGVAVLGLGQLVRMALAAAVGRTRPPAADWAWSASGPAMPSGHTTTSAIVAVLLTAGVRNSVRGRARPVLLVLPALWAAAVGFSRVYLGMHWPTDVLAGWLLAATWTGLLGVSVVCYRRRKAGAVRSTESEGT